MDTVKSKLELIAEIWNTFVWDYKFVNSRINFNADTKTNYFGDILRYFDDTLGLLKKENGDNYESYIFQTIGLLQVIYVQQDFITELLYIFKINCDKELSLDQDRRQNRDLRNKLIGHPIRRKKDEGNKLISSIFWGNYLSSDKIHYVIYHADKSFEGVEEEHLVDDVIVRHINFLSKYLDLIIKKLKLILEMFRSKINNLKRLVDNNVDFVKIVNLTEQIFEHFFNQNVLYEKNTILEIYNQKDIHSRYEFVIECFRRDLSENIYETNNLLNSIIGDNVVLPTANYIMKNYTSDYRKKYDYELVKLYEKHPIYNIQYFLEKYSSFDLICEELRNMNSNINSPSQYYASYEYLIYLINQVK